MDRTGCLVGYGREEVSRMEPRLLAGKVGGRVIHGEALAVAGEGEVWFASGSCEI